MKTLDIPTMHDLLSRFFNTEIMKYVPNCSSSVSQSADRTASALVKFSEFENIESELQQINVCVSKYIKVYIVDVMNELVSDINRNVVLYETEVKGDMIFFRWSF